MKTFFALGSQYNNGGNAGDPATLATTGPDYACAQTDMTPLFNHPHSYAPYSFTDIQHASRTVVWLRPASASAPDIAVVYDRATSLHAGLFKRFNLCLTVVPTIDATHKLATVLTPGGQHFTVQTLLPKTAALGYVSESVNGQHTVGTVAQFEPTIGRLVVEDPANPEDVRFLHVLQGADNAADRLVPGRLASTSGAAFDGVTIGASTVMFPVSADTAAFAGTTYPAPPIPGKHYIAGLTPGTSCKVTTAPSADGTGTDITIAPGGGSYQVDSAGLLRFSISVTGKPIPEETFPDPPQGVEKPALTVAGAKKRTTAKAKLTIKGTTTGKVTSVTAKLGKKTVKAKGLAKWTITVKPLKPGKNKITIVAHGPGGDSKPAKITIIRKP